MEFFSKESARDLQLRLQKALDRFAEENGLKAIVGSATFTPFNICFKVEMALVTQQGEALTREAEDFFLRAASYGLAPQDLGKTFAYGDKTFKVVGLSARSRNNPIIVADENDKRYKFTVALVKALLQVTPSAPQQTSIPKILSLKGG